jgi:hypothetical protein
VQKLTGGIKCNFTDAEQRDVSNYGRIINENCRQRRKLFGSLSILLEDEGQYNKLWQQAVQYVYVASEDQIIQPPTAIVVQVESESISAPSIAITG